MPLRKMPKFPFLFCLLLFALIVVGEHETEGNTGSMRIGAIVDMNSRIGKEEVVAMHMALQDFNFFTKNQSFSLDIRDSKNDPNLAALAAKELISMQGVQILIGSQTWEAASAVAKVGSENKIPVLALANQIPNWANEKFKFLVQASPSQINQMGAIAGFIGSWDWHLVNVIYEATDHFSTTEVFSNLVHSLKDVEAEVSEFVGLSQFDYDSFPKELERLRRGSSRVFVVHMSFYLTLHLFQIAKEMGMLERDYVWITTHSFTSLAHSFNVSTYSMLQGIVGVKSFFPEHNELFQNFSLEFIKKFRSEHSNENNYEPGISAVQAYDAARAAAMAMSESQEKGHDLLDRIKLTNFQGLSGRIEFEDRKLSPANTFEIINVIGRSYKELGFWSDKLGFSQKLVKNSTYNFSMKGLVQVNWPGEPYETPRGWALPTDANPLRIGVSRRTMFKQYLNVEEDPVGKNSTFNGLTIDLFIEILGNLHFPLSYRFHPFNGSYDELAKQIYLKKFDIALDIAAVSGRYKHAEFTLPFTESGLVMIVPTTKDTSNKALLFTKPFTWTMWILIVVFNVYNGFVIWFIERTHYPDRDSSIFDQVGTMVCSSFTTLFSLHGNMLHSNLSRMAMVVWLFVALVITQIYTANLTSMLTIQKLKPTITNIDTLQRTNALVGYGSGSYVQRYLEEVLHFRAENIKNYSTADDYAEALKNQEIAAGFLEAPFVKLFLARYCKGFMIVGPTYKVGGFAFAFPRGSPMLSDMNEALLKVSESGRLRELENIMIANEKCEDGNGQDDSSSLGPNSFYLLFVFSGGVSTIAITFYMLKAHNFSFQQNFMIIVMRHWGIQRRRFYRRVGEEPQTVSNKFSHVTSMQIQV